MTDQQVQAKIESTFIKVVEQLTFMFGEETDCSEIEITPEPWVEARIDFTGDIAGTLAIIVPESLQPEIAANILGLDTEGFDTKEVLDDALGEMLNVVCGHVIMALAGDGANFDLAPPNITELDRDTLDGFLADTNTTAYLLDDEPLLLRLELK